MKKYILIGAIILSIVFIAGCTSSESSTSNKSFENTFVNFNYPDNVKIIDNSTNDAVRISILPSTSTDPNDNPVGVINDFSDNKNKVLQQRSDIQNLTISGYNAVSSKDDQSLYLDVFLDKNTDSTHYIEISTDLDQESVFNTIKNSLTIKSAQF